MAKKSNAKLWLVVHSWCALPIWFFLFFVCLTGSIAAVSGEILWLIYPEMRAEMPHGRALLSADKLATRLLEQQPQVAIRYISRPASYSTVEIAVWDPADKIASFYVDPYSGLIRGQSRYSYSKFQWFIRSLHGWLLTPFRDPVPLGWYAVSILSLPMTLSVVTGLVVYKKFWRGYFRPRLRMRDGARIFWGDVHRLAGLWSLWFVVLISASSLWFLVYGVMQDVGIKGRLGNPPMVAPILSKPRNAILTVDVEQKARDAFPGFSPRFVLSPENNFEPITIIGKSHFSLVNSTVYLHPQTGEPIAVVGLGDEDVISTVEPIFRSLHTGDFYGLASRLVWSLFGLLLSGLILSGLMIWLKRTVQNTSSLMRPRAVVSR